MHDTGCLGLVHWDDLEGWCGEGGGRRVQDEEHMYTCGRFVLMFGKTKQYLRFKNKIKLKKKKVNHLISTLSYTLTQHTTNYKVIIHYMYHLY